MFTDESSDESSAACAYEEDQLTIHVGITAFATKILEHAFY
jgi:hypothetical protein